MVLYFTLGPTEALLAFTWRVAYVCRKVALLVHFLSVEIWKSDSILLFCLIFASFSPSWQCFCCYNILKHSVNLPFMSWGSMALDKVFNRSFLDNSICLFWFLLRLLSISMSHMPTLFSKRLFSHPLPSFQSRLSQPWTS